MKKTQQDKRKLTLRTETVRTLTHQDLTLVVGGRCKYASTNTVVRPPGSDDDDAGTGHTC